MERICKNCGAKLNAEDKVCAACGYSVEGQTEKSPNWMEQSVSDGEKLQDANNLTDQNAGIKENETTNKKNGWGIAGFVFGIIGLLTSCILVGAIADVMGIIFSIKGLLKKGKSKAIAIAGMVCSLLGILIVVWSWNTFSGDVGSDEVSTEVAVLEYDTEVSDIEQNTSIPTENQEQSESQDPRVTEVAQRTEGQKSEDIQQPKSISEEVVEEYEVHLAVEYLDKVFTDGDANTEITIYVDDVEVGTANIGEKYGYEMYLEPGKHELKTVRNWLDRDTFEFEVAENRIYFGVEYNWRGMKSNGELSETAYDGNELDELIYFDMAAEQVALDKLDKNIAVELDDFINQASDMETLHQSIQNTYNLSFTKEQLDGLYDSYTSPAGRLFLGTNGYDMTWVITYRAYDPLYVIDGIWCGMDYDKAYRTLEEKYGADIWFYDFSYDNGKIGMVEELGFMQCFNVNGDCIGIYQLGDRVGEVMYVKDFFEKIPAE